MHTYFIKKVRARKRVANVKRMQSKTVNKVKLPIQHESFLIADYYCNGMRILIFASYKAEDLLQNVEHYFGDGTFCVYYFANYLLHASSNKHFCFRIRLTSTN